MPLTSIEERRRRHKRDALAGVILFGLLQLACTACFAALCFIPELPGWLAVLFAALAVICVLPMGFALVVLRQRFKEIKGGEFDAAAEY